MRASLLAWVFAAAVLPACGSAVHKPPVTNTPQPSQNAPAATAAVPAPGKPPFTQTGMASWYGPGFAGRPTASGEKFDPNDMTCAHPKLKFGTRVQVTNLANGKSVVVRVNDRGPFAKGRIIDVSKEAAKRLGFLEKGTAKVKLEVVSPSVATSN